MPDTRGPVNRREPGARRFDHAELRADVVGSDGHVVVNVVGELDLASAPQLDAVLDGVVATNPSTVVLDLSGLSFADSTGLSVFVKWQRVADQDGLRLVLHAPQRHVRRVLDLSGLATMFDVE